MDKIRACLPWNSSNCIGLNAFHPLYLFLMDDSIKPFYDWLTIDTLAWRDLLAKNENKEVLWDYIKPLFKAIGENQPIEFKEFWSFFNLNEAICVESNDSDLLITHTTPVSSGLKPFIYHLESFETLFYPWHINDNFLKNTSDEKIEKIKAFIKNNLEHPNCLAIVSHVKKTVESIRSCFESEIINQKLFFSPLGISVPAAQRPLIENTSPFRRFLFTPSLHGNSNNYLARGFLTCLFFAEEWLRKYPQDEFVFLSPMPKYDTKWKKWISKQQWDQVTSHANIIFLGGNYITEKRMSRLLAKVDYVFLLSHQLHSISLLRSMAFGAIPIVIDLPELKDYGINQENSIFVELYGRLRTEKVGCFGEIPLVDTFIQDSLEIVPEVVTQVSRVRDNPEIELQRRRNAFALIQENFNIEVAAQGFHNIIKRQYKNAIGICSDPEIKNPQYEKYFGGREYFFPSLRPVKFTDFDRRPLQYVVLNLGSSHIFSNGEEHIAVTRNHSINPIFVTSFNLNYFPEVIGLNFTFNDVLKNALAHSYSPSSLGFMAYHVADGNKLYLSAILHHFVIERPKLKKLLKPFYVIYKKIIKKNIPSLPNHYMQMSTKVMFVNFIRQRPKLKATLRPVVKSARHLRAFLPE